VRFRISGGENIMNLLDIFRIWNLRREGKGNGTIEKQPVIKERKAEKKLY